MDGLKHELASVGIELGGFYDGAPYPKNKGGLTSNQLKIFDAIVRAHGKRLAAKESTELRGLLGDNSAEWLAYLEARKAAIKEARQARYAAEVDALRNDIEESALQAGKTPDFSPVWALKDAIRALLSYPE